MLSFVLIGCYCSYAILKLLIYLLSYLLHHQIYCNQTITSITIMKAIEQLSIPGQGLTPNHANVVPAPVSAPCLCSQWRAGRQPGTISVQWTNPFSVPVYLLYTLLSTFAFFVGTRVTQCIQLPASSSQ